MKVPGRSRARSGAGALGAVMVLLVALGGLVFFVLRGRGRGALELDPTRVVVVEEKDVIDSVNATGRVEPLARVAVMSRASGIIEAFLVDAGDEVQAGQVLVELDREQLEAQWAQDEADLMAAQARVQAAEARVAEARVRVADPELEFLRRERGRVDDLFGQGAVSVRERDETQRALAMAEFRVQLVEASLPVLEAAVLEAQAQLAASRASLERSATALRESTIRCPMDGIVLTREKEIGDGVSSILTAGGNATEILTLGDLSTMHVEARVDEVDLGRIHVGMPALITVDAHRGNVLEGEVRRIAPAGSVDDNGIVTFEVEVTTRDPERILKPDMTAEARLVIARKDRVPVLPQVALKMGEDGKWRVDRIVGAAGEERIEPTLVEPGLSDGLMTEIQSGLSAGDRVLLPIARRGR